MAPTLEALGIDQMSVEDRIALAQAIWDSIPEERSRPPLSEAKRKELENRLADHRANPHDVVPWEQIEADAIARFRK